MEPFNIELDFRHPNVDMGFKYALRHFQWQVKDTENIFDLCPKWARTLPMGNFIRGIYGATTPYPQYRVWTFTLCCSVWGAETHPGI